MARKAKRTTKSKANIKKSSRKSKAPMNFGNAWWFWLFVILIVVVLGILILSSL
jgi:hypothetical protein